MSAITPILTGFHLPGTRPRVEICLENIHLRMGAASSRRAMGFWPVMPKIESENKCNLRKNPAFATRYHSC